MTPQIHIQKWRKIKNRKYKCPISTFNYNTPSQCKMEWIFAVFIALLKHKRYKRCLNLGRSSKEAEQLLKTSALDTLVKYWTWRELTPFDLVQQADAYRRKQTFRQKAHGALKVQVAPQVTSRSHWKYVAFKAGRNSTQRERERETRF